MKIHVNFCSWEVVWKKDMIIKLAISMHICMYDTKNKCFYKNKHARKDAIFKIGEYLKKEANVDLEPRLQVKFKKKLLCTTA